jgi:hypothetical protein
MVKLYTLLAAAGGDSVSVTITVTAPVNATVGVPLMIPPVEILSPLGNPAADQI